MVQTRALPSDGPTSSYNSAGKIDVASEPVSGGPVITPILSSSTLSTTRLPPRKRRISRRTALIGLAGAAALGAAAVVTGSFLVKSGSTDQKSVPSPGTTGTATGSPTSALQPLVIFHGHSAAVNAVAWSANGTYIVSGSSDYTTQVWRAADGSKTFSYNDGNSINAVAWSSNRRYFAFGATATKEVQIYDAYKFNRIYSYGRHGAAIFAVAFSPDSQYIASGSADNTVRVWTPSNGNLLSIYKRHTRGIHGLAWSPDGKYIASASPDHTVQVWEASSGNLLFKYTRHTDEVRAVTWSPDGAHIASAGLDGTIQLYSAANGTFIVSANDGSGNVHDVMWSPDGTRIASANKDRPLSFLDHHLRAGNALIGSWLEDVAAGQHPKAKQAQKHAQQTQEAEKEAGQLVLSLFDEDFRQVTRSALDTIATIEQSPGITIKDVKAQEAAYEELRQRFSEKYLHLANLGAALYYDLEVGSNVWRALADYALGKAIEHVQSPQFENWLDAAAALANKKHFFHWELEFPNIFFDSNGQPLGESAGFDVVIGNPPYVRQEQLGPDKPFFQDRYEVYHGVADLFVYFFAQGLRLLRKDGRLVYISSNTWLYANYGTPLRHYLRTQTTIEEGVQMRYSVERSR